MLRTTHCEGTHSILVNLALLSPAVVELFITMSSYCGRLKARAARRAAVRLSCEPAPGLRGVRRAPAHLV